MNKHLGNAIVHCVGEEALGKGWGCGLVEGLKNGGICRWRLGHSIIGCQTNSSKSG